MKFKKEKVIGVDEAGRGPLAGPVFAAAVLIKNKTDFLKDIKDSKLIAEKKREDLFDKIANSEEITFSVACSGPKLVDEVNVLEATKKAMEEAIDELETRGHLIIVDGDFSLEIKEKQKSIIKADETVLECSAASIVAKVSRDRFMREMDEKFPGYGFARHKGYPTKEHKEAIKRLGPCPIHRKSFKLV